MIIISSRIAASIIFMLYFENCQPGMVQSDYKGREIWNSLEEIEYMEVGEEIKDACKILVEISGWFSQKRIMYSRYHLFHSLCTNWITLTKISISSIAEKNLSIEILPTKYPMLTSMSKNLYDASIFKTTPLWSLYYLLLSFFRFYLYSDFFTEFV